MRKYHSIDYEAFGERVKARRQELKLTQNALAERLDCNESYISRIEKGNANPTLDFVYLLATELGVGVDYFLPFTHQGANALQAELDSKVVGCSPELLLFLDHILEDAHQLETQLLKKKPKENE